MTRVFFTLTAAAMALTACSGVEQVADQTGRRAATSVVTEVIALNFPQVPKPLIQTFTGCVVDNAPAVEVRELAKAAIVGIDDTTIDVVRTGLARPATQSCLRQGALTNL